MRKIKTPQETAYVTEHGTYKKSPQNTGDILAEARQIVSGSRQNAYGKPERSFALIAEFWTAYLSSVNLDCGGVAVLAHDVALMMALLKIARATVGDTYHRDNAVDLAGYAACYDSILGDTENE